MAVRVNLDGKVSTDMTRPIPGLVEFKSLGQSDQCKAYMNAYAGLVNETAPYPEKRRELLRKFEEASNLSEKLIRELQLAVQMAVKRQTVNEE